VARCFEDVDFDIAKPECVAVTDLPVEGRDLRCVSARTNDFAAGLGFKGGIALGVVMVVMRGEYVGEPPALFDKSGLNCFRFGSVDRTP